MTIRVRTAGQQPRTLDPHTVDPEVEPRDEVAEAADRVEAYLKAALADGRDFTLESLADGEKDCDLTTADLRTLIKATRR